MPTYDYECGKCGNRFEVFQKMSAEPVTSCSKCKGKAHRLIGAGSGIIFKGNGFYHTDYKNNKKSKEERPCQKSDPSSDSCKSCSLNKKKGKD